MTEFHVTTIPTKIAPRDRSSVLARVYEMILRWAPPLVEKRSESTNDLDVELAVSEPQLSSSENAALPNVPSIQNSPKSRISEVTNS